MVIVSTDFCISHNLLPVVFERDDNKYDMTVSFILAFWACYVNAMHNRPCFTNVVAQKVLKYLLGMVAMVVKTWRGRLYHYSSGTIFKSLEAPMQAWLKNGQVNQTVSHA